MNVAQQMEKEGNYYDLVDEKERILHEKLLSRGDDFFG
jgi:hypothetical protein